jgi:hypothetical protein
MIATNTISQGDTREGGLLWLVAAGWTIYDATVDLPWPGEAAVTVSVVHCAMGSPSGHLDGLRLNGNVVRYIDSRFQPVAERANPIGLRANLGKAFLGCKVGGQGFVLSADEAEQLRTTDTRNSGRIFLYIGGEDINSHPLQISDRFVIDFAQVSEEEIEEWPDLAAIVRERVKPSRLESNRDSHRKYWWRFAEVYPSMRAAIAPLSRCLVSSIHTKHLIFCWQPSDRVFSHALNVFALHTDAWLAVLQSRIHEPWARLLSSSMKTDLRYSATDCFATFPFPPDMTLPTLNAAGHALDTARAAYMIEHNQGLTTTYNQLKDRTHFDPQVEHLRRLHEAMDRAVLAAYGWQDIPVPAYGTADPEAQRAFDDEVIDRLYALNAKRAAEEAQAAEQATKADAEAQLAGKITATPKKARAKKPRPDDDNHDGQLGLL